jgi:hypothetical protein
VALLIIFVALLVLLAWLSVTIVKSAPSSFASLASLAESVRTFDTSRLEQTADNESPAPTLNLASMLIVTSDTNVVESNGEVLLSWTDTTTPGSFVFNYECTDGVALAIVEATGIRAIECATSYNVGDRNRLRLRVTSETNRFVDVPYSIAFITSEAAGPQAMDNAVLTIVNEAVPLTATSVGTPDATGPIPTLNEPATSVESTTVTEPAPTPTSADTEFTTTPTVPFEQEFTYTIPISDPTGRVDLATRFVAVGSLIDNTFVPGTTDLNSPEPVAVQFEVKNLGTKTSADWQYQLTLPTGETVASDQQAPLRPNERALITVGFPATGITATNLSAVITTTEDSTLLNNQFTTTVD